MSLALLDGGRVIVPLAEVIRRAESARRMFHLSRETILDLCLGCTALACDTSKPACLGRQAKNQRQREQYAVNAERRREQARGYYAANPEASRAKSAAYQRDPEVLAARSIKSRMRYAEARHAEGREVNAYTWRNPLKNKGVRA